MRWNLFFIGGLVIVGRNWWQYQQDKRRNVVKPPLPSLVTWENLPTVSVLVAAWNESEMIGHHINSFCQLNYPHKQLVLVAGGNDGTFECARERAEETILVLEQRAGEGKQRALARGFEQTTGEIIYLTDADCVLDDDSFLRVIRPIANKTEAATSGGVRPLTEQLANPLVLIKAASEQFLAYRPNAPQHTPGLQGANCAIRRELLRESHALNADAPTGTDYVLAKEIVRQGETIRQVYVSRIATKYVTRPRHYVAQQRRWLQNVVHYGWRYRAYTEMQASLITSLLGGLMLLLPFIGKPGRTVWGLLLLQGTLARLRYIAFYVRLEKIEFTMSWLFALPSLLLDSYAWATALFGRRKW